ncbi:MAG: MoaD/ThiS family protein [Candidatus Limnocylindrales bacterium]
MATVQLPRSLVALFPGDPPRRLELEATSVDALIDALDVRWPGMRDRLVEPGPRIREFINVFVDGQRVTLAAPLTTASIVHIIPAVAGGAVGLKPFGSRAPDRRPRRGPLRTP